MMPREKYYRSNWEAGLVGTRKRTNEYFEKFKDLSEIKIKRRMRRRLQGIKRKQSRELNSRRGKNDLSSKRNQSNQEYAREPNTTCIFHNEMRSSNQNFNNPLVQNLEDSGDLSRYGAPSVRVPYKIEAPDDSSARPYRRPPLAEDQVFGRDNNTAHGSIYEQPPTNSYNGFNSRSTGSNPFAISKSVGTVSSEPIRAPYEQSQPTINANNIAFRRQRTPSPPQTYNRREPQTTHRQNEDFHRNRTRANSFARSDNSRTDTWSQRSHTPRADNVYNTSLNRNLIHIKTEPINRSFEDSPVSARYNENSNNRYLHNSETLNVPPSLMSVVVPQDVVNKLTTPTQNVQKKRKSLATTETEEQVRVPKPLPEKLATKQTTPEVVYLGKLENILHLEDSDNTPTENIADTTTSVTTKKTRVRRKKSNSCELCDLVGHTEMQCKMICKNCNEPYHNMRTCSQSDQTQKILVNFLEYSVKEFINKREATST